MLQASLYVQGHGLCLQGADSIEEKWDGPNHNSVTSEHRMFRNHSSQSHSWAFCYELSLSVFGTPVLGAQEIPFFPPSSISK